MLYFPIVVRYLLGQSGSALLYDLFRVGLGEDDNGVELCIVEFVHGCGRDVEEGVLLSLIHI